MIGISRASRFVLWLLSGFLGTLACCLAGTDPGLVPVPSDPPPPIWTRDTLLGDLGGARTRMSEYGIAIVPSYTGEVMGNVSGGAGGYDGVGRGVIYEHLVNVPLDVDLSKTVPGWDATFHVNAMWIAGPGLSPSYVGDIGDVSGIQAFNTVRLQELWFQQNFWDKRISLKVGEIASDYEFAVSNTAAVFFNGTFGMFNLLETNLVDPVDPNVYPVAAPGVRLLVQPVPCFSLMVGVFDGTAESQTANPNGVNFPFDTDSGALIFAEVAYLLNQAPGDHGLQGTYKLGSFVHTHDFNGWGSQEAAALGTGRLTSSGTDYGIYGMADQQLYARDKKVVSAFARVGSAPSDVNVIDWYVDGGFNFTGFVPGRDGDIAGIAVACSMFSDQYSAFQVAANGTRPFNSETVLEATYQVKFTPWWYVQPDFQYIWTPGGQQGAANAAVLGLRTGITF